MREKNVILTNKVILVTGAAGFIGSNLVLELLREAHPEPSWEFIKGSIADKEGFG